MEKIINSTQLESACLAEDITEENQQLREEIKRLTSLLVSDSDDKFSDDNSSTLESCMDSSNEKSFTRKVCSSTVKAGHSPHHHKITVENENLRKEALTLKKEVEYFDIHCKKQAATIKTLSERIESMQHTHHLMEADLLELFPLRLKLRELEKVLKGHNELILSLQLDNQEYLRKIQNFDLMKTEMDNQREIIVDLKAKLSHYQSQEQGIAIIYIAMKSLTAQWM